jgi:predicted secreted protein
MKKSLIIVLLGLGFLTASQAGDMANFVNLGFSDDSRYFMFGQYGLNEGTSLPYAEIFTIDVARNEYASQGVKRVNYNVAAQPGQNGYGALLTALHEFAVSADDPVRRYRINHNRTGRLVYLLINGSTGPDRIEFRDFSSGNNYAVVLSQSSAGTGAQVSSSFFLTLTVTDRNGVTTPRIVGTPNRSRSGIQGYRVKEAVFSPDESSLIFVIEMTQHSPQGTNFRYMVETVTLR